MIRRLLTTTAAYAIALPVLLLCAPFALVALVYYGCRHRRRCWHDEAADWCDIRLGEVTGLGLCWIIRRRPGVDPVIAIQLTVGEGHPKNN